MCIYNTCRFPYSLFLFYLHDVDEFFIVQNGRLGFHLRSWDRLDAISILLYFYHTHSLACFLTCPSLPRRPLLIRSFFVIDICRYMYSGFIYPSENLDETTYQIWFSGWCGAARSFTANLAG